MKVRSSQKFSIIDLPEVLGTDENEFLKATIISLAENKETRKIGLNFKNVEYIQSETLGIIIFAYKKISQENGEMVLCGANPQIEMTLKVTGIDKIIKLYPTEETLP